MKRVLSLACLLALYALGSLFTRAQVPAVNSGSATYPSSGTICTTSVCGGSTSGWSGIAASLVTTATQYAPFVGGRTTTATGAESTVQVAASATATITNLKVSLDAAVGAMATVAVTLRDGGMDTALTCTTASGGTSCSDTTHSVAVTLGDLVNFKIVATGTVTAATPNIIISYAVAANGAVSASALLDTISSTQGSILYRGASAWSALAPGTSGNFLKTQGASANPTWAAVSTGASTESHTANNSAVDLEYTTCISSPGRVYTFYLTNIYLASNNIDLNFQVSTDGGSTWQSTGYEYITTDNSTSNAGLSALNSTSASGALLFTGIDNTSAYGTSATITLYDPLSTTTGKEFDVRVASTLQAVARRYTNDGKWFWDAGGHPAVNAFRIVAGAGSSGNIKSGTGACYAVAN